VQLGVISYGFYLYHPIVIGLFHEWGARNHVSHLARFTPIYLALSLAASWISYKFYEKPIIDWGHARSGRVAVSKETGLTAGAPTT
jgi:peptidoglycan/LPS O-acetylase OafA/YrhL